MRRRGENPSAPAREIDLPIAIDRPSDLTEVELPDVEYGKSDLRLRGPFRICDSNFEASMYLLW